MPSDRSLVEREMQRLELRPFTLEGFHRQRERRERNRRIRAGIVALVVAAAGTGALVRGFSSEVVPAGDPRSPFLGIWIGTDLDGSTQRMTIGASEDGAVEIVLHDDAATVCSSVPAKVTGTGRLEGPRELVIPSRVLTCDDGSEPQVDNGPPIEEQLLRDMTFLHNPQTDALADSFGVVWNRVGRENPTTENGEAVPEPFEFLNGEVTLHAADPWTESPFIWGLDFGGSSNAFIQLVGNPWPVGTGCRTGPAPADAEALARAIRSDPDLAATVPVAVTVGEIDAVRMDVTAAAGSSACEAQGGPPPQVLTGDHLWPELAPAPGTRMRLYLLDLPEGSSARILALAIVAPETLFEQVVEAAAPIVDSVEFHAP